MQHLICGKKRVKLNNYYLKRLTVKKQLKPYCFIPVVKNLPRLVPQSVINNDYTRNAN